MNELNDLHLELGVTNNLLLLLYPRLTRLAHPLAPFPSFRLGNAALFITSSSFIIHLLSPHTYTHSQLIAHRVDLIPHR